MNFLDFVQQPPPRDERTVKTFSRSFWSIFGFIAYGILYGFLSLMFICCVAMFVDVVILSDLRAQDHNWYGISLDVFICALFAFSWVPFAQWVRRRIGNSTRLFREGILVEGRISSPKRRYIRGAPYTTLILEFDVEGESHKAALSAGGHPATLFEPNPTCPVLYHRESPYCIGVIDPQKPTPAKLYR